MDLKYCNTRLIQYYIDNFYFIMALKRVRSSNFKIITRFVMNRIKKHRSITLVQLNRILCSSFGIEYFLKRQNISLLMNVVEYLLYTKRLIVVDPNVNFSLQMETTVNNNNNCTVKFNK